VIKSSSDKPKQNSTFLFSQHGSEFTPTYGIRHLDPSQHSSKNRYAAAITDAFNPDVIYAEVLLMPAWTQPSLNAEQIRQNGGVPPPPEPVLPTEVVIQLYNPDQQIVVKHKPASWNTAAAWEFEMPKQTFRPPSFSALDRSQSDPAASDVTPRIGLKWKKDGKLSKDLVCFQSGQSVDPDGTKKKQKEPDITVAIFKALKEVTLYEPNLARVEIEDVKGLEVVLLLGAVVIRDVYFGNMKEIFHLAERKSSASSQKNASTAVNPLLAPTSQSPTALDSRPVRDPRVPPTDARSQWELDAETTRLRRQAAEEERQRRRKEEEQEKQLRRMLEAEEKEERRKQAEVDRETERLKRLYGQQNLPIRPHGGPVAHRYSHPAPANFAPQPIPQIQLPNAWGSYNAGPYMSGAASQSSFLSPMPQQQQQQRVKNKSSIFSFRRNGEQDETRLQKKRSAIF
jgi:hypothetical protein